MIHALACARKKGALDEFESNLHIPLQPRLRHPFAFRSSPECCGPFRVFPKACLHLTVVDICDSASAGSAKNGKGRRFGYGMGRMVNAVLEGWAVSGIFQYISGEYLRLPAAVVTDNPKLDNRTRDRWFDTSKITRQPDFSQGARKSTSMAGLHGPSRHQSGHDGRKGIPDQRTSRV
jgi:hypothetical protein